MDGQLLSTLIGLGSFFILMAWTAIDAALHPEPPQDFEWPGGGHPVPVEVEK